MLCFYSKLQRGAEGKIFYTDGGVIKTQGTYLPVLTLHSAALLKAPNPLILAPTNKVSIM